MVLVSKCCEEDCGYVRDVENARLAYEAGVFSIKSRLLLVVVAQELCNLSSIILISISPFENSTYLTKI